MGSLESPAPHEGLHGLVIWEKMRRCLGPFLLLYRMVV